MNEPRRARSLRGRLLLILLPPMIVVASAASLWRYQDARTTAEALYDKTLLAVTVAIAVDVATTGGDLIPEAKLTLLSKNLGDDFYYRVVGPGGGFVTGRVDAPAAPRGKEAQLGKPLFFNATYRSAPVRVAIYLEIFQGAPPDSLDGPVEVTVWQAIREREAFAASLARRSILLMAAIVAVAAAVLWFGVGLGLQPLLQLENAISKRSQRNLAPIARSVPAEVTRLVTSMNALFKRLSDAIAAREVFIGDAAHQLRNPIAAIRGQAEAACATNDLEEIQNRLTGVADAARSASRLAQQLLSSEKARSGGVSDRDRLDLGKLVAEIARAHAPEILRRNGHISFEGPDDPLMVTGDETMIREATENLIDNASHYGFGGKGQIDIRLARDGSLARLSVTDDGEGVPEDARAAIFERFKRVARNNDDGCGLGLAIVRDVARAHDGDAWLEDTGGAGGACFVVTLVCDPDD